jgi:hypothetical protein
MQSIQNIKRGGKSFPAGFVLPSQWESVPLTQDINGNKNSFPTAMVSSFHWNLFRPFVRISTNAIWPTGSCTTASLRIRDILNEPINRTHLKSGI